MYKGERLNSISHLIGAVFALAGGAVLVTFAAMDGNARKIISYSVYGLTLFLLYLVSTIYHSLTGPAKRVFQVLDHQTIYLLIAGTYTPFALVALNGALGWKLFGAIWGLAAFGIVLDARPRKGSRAVPITIYLVMGWLCLFALDPIIAALPAHDKVDSDRHRSATPYAAVRPERSQMPPAPKCAKQLQPKAPFRI